MQSLVRNPRREQALKIAITGKLTGLTKKEAATLMESVGAEFTNDVTYDTNYLVAAMLDSGQAKKARAIGVEVITQSEFEDYIDLGGFADNNTPTRPKPGFPEIPWNRLSPESQFSADMSYHDRYGEVTDRRITILAEGSLQSRTGNPRHYIQAVDHTEGDQIRTFRRDRIISISRT